MSIEERIEKYYLERIERYSNEIGNVIENLLGPEFRLLYDSRKNGFKPVFIVKMEDIKFLQGGTLTSDDAEVVEYLLDKMECSGNDFIVLNSEFQNRQLHKNILDFLNNEQISTFGFYNNVRKEICTYFKIDVFSPVRDGLRLDFNYCNALLTYLLTFYDIAYKKWYFLYQNLSINCDIEDVERKIYLRIVKSIALQIVALLRQKKVHLLDNVDDFDMELAEGTYEMVDPRFLLNFKKLIPTFLLNPNEFVKEVGIDNFRDFVLCNFDEENEFDSGDVIARMVNESKKEKIPIISLNDIYLGNGINYKFFNGEAWMEPLLEPSELIFLKNLTDLPFDSLKALYNKNSFMQSNSKVFNYYFRKYLNKGDFFKKWVLGGVFNSSISAKDVEWLCYYIQNSTVEELQEDLKSGSLDCESSALKYLVSKYANSGKSGYMFDNAYVDFEFLYDDNYFSIYDSSIKSYSVEELKDMLKKGAFNNQPFVVRYYIRRYIKDGDNFKFAVGR